MVVVSENHEGGAHTGATCGARKSREGAGKTHRMSRVGWGQLYGPQDAQGASAWENISVFIYRSVTDARSAQK